MWVINVSKSSGSGASNRKLSPVTGCSNPKTAACNSCRLNPEIASNAFGENDFWARRHNHYPNVWAVLIDFWVLLSFFGFVVALVLLYSAPHTKTPQNITKQQEHFSYDYEWLEKFRKSNALSLLQKHVYRNGFSPNWELEAGSRKPEVGWWLASISWTHFSYNSHTILTPQHRKVLIWA